MKNNIFVNNVFLIVISLVLLLLSLSDFVYFIFFVIYIIYIIRRFKNNKMFIVVNICLLVFTSLYFVLLEIKYNDFIMFNEEIRFESRIYDIEYSKDKLRYICKYDKRKVIVYYDEEELDVGDYIYIIGDSIEIEGNRIKNFFNYKNYLKHEKISGIVYANEIKVLKNGFNINSIKQLVFRYVNKYIKDDDSNMILKALVLGDSSNFSDELDEDLRINGIVHLFAVSGLHISLFIMMFTYVLNSFKMKEKYCDIVISIFLFFYIVITSFSASILRASLMYYFTLVNKHFFKSLFSSLDICSFSFIVLVLINPYIAFNLGFILSYMVCFVLVLSSSLIKTKNNNLQVLYMSILSNVFTLPIVININYEINILSPLINVFFISFTSSIILPFTFVLLLIPIFGFVYKYLIDVFLLMIKFSSYFFINLDLPYFDNIYIIIYYGIIFLFLVFVYNKKLRILFISLYCIFLVLFSNKDYFYNKNSIDCLYLNDGEAMLIRNKRYNVLIDSGDGYNDEVYNFLRSEGIKKLDYFIITHEHNDHFGGAKKILENIRVDKLIVTCVNTSDFSRYDNVIKAKIGDVFTIGDIRFEVLFPYQKSNEENDNSLVTYFSFCEYNILCLGDLTVNEEDEVISYLEQKNYDVDIIKIGHHGSNSSTSIDLLDYCKAKYAIIMVGKKWIDVFPNLGIINRLNEYNITVFSTKDYYSFKLYFHDKKIYISSVH